MRSYKEAKAMARSLRNSLATREISLAHSECLEIVARQFGFRDWNILSSKLDVETGRRKGPAELSGIEWQPAIPVVRVRSAREATEFYVGLLGFAFDWGGGTSGEELYAQISRSGVTLHVSTSGADSCSSEVLIRMTGLDAFRQELTNRGFDHRDLRVYETPDDRRELHVIDPFGNRLRFSENNPPGVSNDLDGV